MCASLSAKGSSRLGLSAALNFGSTLSVRRYLRTMLRESRVRRGKPVQRKTRSTPRVSAAGECFQSKTPCALMNSAGKPPSPLDNVRPRFAISAPSLARLALQDSHCKTSALRRRTRLPRNLQLPPRQQRLGRRRAGLGGNRELGGLGQLRPGEVHLGFFVGFKRDFPDAFHARLPPEHGTTSSREAPARGLLRRRSPAPERILVAPSRVREAAL